MGINAMSFLFFHIIVSFRDFFSEVFVQNTIVN